MGETGFPQFNRLPQELKDRIWDDAVRPESTPAIHRFIIHGHGFPSTARVSSIRGSRVRLAAEYTLLIPWDDNDSAYGWDGALWTTCRDSRDAMYRRFKKNEWWCKIGKQHAMDRPKELVGEIPRRLAARSHYGDADEVAHTATYLDRGGTWQYITFLNRDLIHLDPLGIDSVDWFHHHPSDDLALISYDATDDGKTKRAPCYLPLNIAFDYDPVLLPLMEGREVHRCHGPLKVSRSGLLDMMSTIRVWAGCEVWFVDYRLRRRERGAGDEHSQHHPSASDGQERPRRKFYSQDAVYVEVCREDADLWTTDPGEGPALQFLYYLFHAADLFARLLACEVAPGKPPKRQFPSNPEGGCHVCNPPPPTRKRPRSPSPGDSDGDSITAADLDLFG